MSDIAENRLNRGIKAEIIFWLSAIYFFWLLECSLIYFQIALYAGKWYKSIGWGLLQACSMRFTPGEALSGLFIYLIAGVFLCIGSIISHRIIRKIKYFRDVTPLSYHTALFTCVIITLYGWIIINIVISPLSFSMTDLVYTALWGLASILIGIVVYRHFHRMEDIGIDKQARWGLVTLILICLFGFWPWLDYHTKLQWTTPAGLAVRSLIFFAIILIYNLFLYFIKKKKDKNKIPGDNASGFRSIVKNIIFLLPAFSASLGFLLSLVPERGLGKSDVAMLSDNPPNILLISMDTVRADGLSCYSPTTGKTPFIDSIASRGVIFEDARSPTCWTLPGHASMFTSLYPSAHGATWEYTYLKKSYVTLAEILKTAGYKTACFSSNVWVSPFTDVTQGFDYFYMNDLSSLKRRTEERPQLMCEVLWLPLSRRLENRGMINNPESSKMHRARKINGAVKQWIEDPKNGGAPSFIFINYMEAHNPYTPPKGFQPDAPKNVNRLKVNLINGNPFLAMSGKLSMTAGELGYFKSLYYASIEFEDTIIKDVYSILDNKGFMKNAIVIITADHGEYLGEHDQFYHLFGVHEPVIRVPFILYAPGRAPEGVRFSGMAQTVDIPPTVLELCRIKYKWANQFQGKSAMPFLKNNSPIRPYAISEVMYPVMPLKMAKGAKVPEDIMKKWMVRNRSITDGHFQLEEHFERDTDKMIGSPIMWQINRDVGIYKDITGMYSDKEKEFDAEFDKWLSSFPHAKPSDRDQPLMSPEFEKQLKAIGYLQ